ncbi:MAG: amidase [bacterium]
MAEPWRLTLSEGIDLIHQGSLSAADWTRSLLSRIDQCEERVKAWVQVDQIGALKAAEKVDEVRAHGHNLGPLAGAPYAAKDIFDIKGLKREAGSPLYRGYVAEEDAACVARLRAAGAIALGKAVTTQFANGDPSITRNPWNLERSPGGSSAGSAAAVAAGMVPAALGSQTTGSTLRPAAFCGVVALKPTYGRIPRGGIIKVSWTFDHVGLIARSIEDLARMLEVMSGPDESDDGAPEVDVPAYAACSAPRRPERVCFLKEDFLPEASDEVADWISRAVSQLKENGVTVEEGRLSIDPEQIHAAHFIARCVDSATYHEDMFIENADEYAPAARTTVTTGLMVPAVHYLKALRLRARFTREMDRLSERYDLIVLPTQMDTPPPWEESTGDPKFNEQLTFSAHPALTLPVGRGEGNLPIGIQLGGGRFRESDLFAAARWCEAELGWRAEIAEPVNGR